MRSEMRNQILAAMDETAKNVGAETFEECVDVVCRVGEKLISLLEQMRTRERAIETLDQMPDFPPEEERLAVAAFRMLLQFLVIQAREQLPGVLKDLPGGKKGRGRALSDDKQVAACDLIGKLYREGVGMSDCKKRACLRFDISTRTVERIWANRAKVWSKGTEPDFQEVMNWTKKLFTE